MLGSEDVGAGHFSVGLGEAGIEGDGGLETFEDFFRGFVGPAEENGAGVEVGFVGFGVLGAAGNVVVIECGGFEAGIDVAFDLVADGDHLILGPTVLEGREVDGVPCTDDLDLNSYLVACEGELAEEECIELQCLGEVAYTGIVVLAAGEGVGGADLDSGELGERVGEVEAESVG